MLRWLRVGLLLAATILFFGTVTAEEFQALKVLYDRGDPVRSVVILENQVLQQGDLYGPYRLIGVDPDAIVLEDAASREFFKVVESGNIPEQTLRRARHQFIANQMKAIHQAQVDYQHFLGKGFAPDLETLIAEGVLADGFEPFYEKQGYVFRMAETREYYGKDPSFLAVAEPLQEGELFFSVDQLGHVRTADTINQIRWGPVWGYLDRDAKVESVDISVKE